MRRLFLQWGRCSPSPLAGEVRRGGIQQRLSLQFRGLSLLRAPHPNPPPPAPRGFGGRVFLTRRSSLAKAGRKGEGIRFSLFAIPLLLLFLAACSSDKDSEAKEEAMKEKKEAEAKAAAEYKPKLICPQVAIVRSLETLRDYGAEKPAHDQLVAVSRMQGLDGNCSYEDEGIDVSFMIHFAAAKGPRLGGERADFPYFVAVVDPAGAILNKNQMTEEFRFKEDEKVAKHDEPLHVFIPLPKDKKDTGPDYRVLAGFQLTEEQLAETKRMENKKTK